MTPEERERLSALRGGRGGEPGGRGDSRGVAGRAGAASGRGGRAGGAPQAAPAGLAQQNPGATTIDALFGPLPLVESRGRVFAYANKQLMPIPVRLGITDGQATELLEGDLEPGMELVTNVITTSEATRPTGGAFPPFMGPQGGRGGDFNRGGPGGNRGGGGGGGNRGGGR